MERYQVILAYDGTQFEGFQRQGKARTVQGVVEAALRQIGWQGRTILAAGRTDSGVHATGQVIAFDLAWPHPEEDLLRALNANLPLDVAARSVKAVAASFHPRFDALARSYCYHIECEPVRSPLRERYAWRVWPPLALVSLEQAARYLPGRHDFAAFGTPPHPKGSTVRTVFAAGWSLDGTRLVFTIRADAFLYHMVRRLVAAQVQIGQGLRPPEALAEALETTLPLTQGLAPPQGLVLTQVDYPPN